MTRKGEVEGKIGGKRMNRKVLLKKKLEGRAGKERRMKRSEEKGTEGRTN